MNWKELYALVNENIKNAVSGLYKPAGDVTFAELPELSQSVLGYTYTVTDAFTTDSRFTDYDTETQTGHSFPADTEVAVIVTGTTENLVYMFNVMGGIMDGYATKGDLDNYVEKEAGKSLSTNDYTDADKALVQESPITTTATGTDLTLSTSSGNLNALTVYGKSEVVDGAIVSAGEGWATVDLGTLNWSRTVTETFAVFEAKINGMYVPTIVTERLIGIMCNCYPISTQTSYVTMDNKSMQRLSGHIIIKDNDYTDAASFKSAMSGVLLCYQLADPTQGNTIAVKTDNGYGVDGTMAVFETGTPLYGVSDTVRDVMTWDGSAGTVTKKCAKVRLADLTWTYWSAKNCFSTPDISSSQKIITAGQLSPYLCTKYTVTAPYIYGLWQNSPNKSIFQSISEGFVVIHDTDYTTVSDFVASLGNAELIYELATPTTEQLTATENTSIAGLRTFQPRTHAQNNAGATMTIEAYAGTANGKAISDLKTELQITQSDTLTLTVAGWSNNAQTVTYAHNTAKRNVIDVDPSSIEEWASCGILATAETASGITFTCKTVPENALNFKVTSMGVN